MASIVVPLAPDLAGGRLRTRRVGNLRPDSEAGLLGRSPESVGCLSQALDLRRYRASQLVQL
jgi:hypothetical protein